MAAASLLLPLIERIAALQSAGNQYYPAGLFPSQRRKAALGYCREDSNVFFTALVVLALQDIRGRLPAAAQAVVANITEKARAVYPLYQNPKGLAIYNFYQTQPRQHFPNGYLLRRTRHFAPPDDVDTTALVYLTDPRPAPANKALKTRLQAHANGVQGWATTGPPAFRGLRIYSAWFGEYMPIDLDACTLANTLLWVLRAGLPFNEFDTNSLAFINWVIASGEYRRRPLQVAAYYARPPLIAYHAGRLLAEAELPALAEARATLLRELPELLAGSAHFTDKIMLGTTLLRLGASPPALLGASWGVAELETRSQGHAFFIAPLLNYYPHTRWLARWPLSQLEWHCPAHALALLAEYVALGGG